MIKTLSLITVGVVSMDATSTEVESDHMFAQRYDQCRRAKQLLDHQRRWTDYKNLRSNWSDEWDVRDKNGQAYFWDHNQATIDRSVDYNGATPAEMRNIYRSGKFWSPRTDSYSFDLWGYERSQEDVSQGFLGDCYALTAFATAAHFSLKKDSYNDSARIVRKVLPLAGDSSKNIYPFTFFEGGMPKRMFVDGNIVVKNKGSNSVRPAFARLGKDGSFWVALFEKAWAKFNGNYSNIQGGLSGEVIAAMTGAPFEFYSKQRGGDRQYHNVNDMFRLIKDGINQGNLVTLGSEGDRHAAQNSIGIVPAHAYQVMQWYEYREHGRTKYLVKVRDPQAKDNYGGAFSDRNLPSAAHNAVRAKDGYRDNADDGVIYMGNDELWRGFGSVSISQIKFDYQVGFVESTWSGSRARTYSISNPAHQELIIVIQTTNDRRNPCTQGVSTVTLNWRKHGGHERRTLQLYGGIATLRATVPRGNHELDVTFNFARGETDFSYTVKTMAPRHASIKQKGSRFLPSCYTFEDAIGNWDIKTNGVSSNCSKRTPPNWWHSSNHQPGGGYNSGSRGTPTTNSCVENALANPHRTRGVTRKSTARWNEYFYGKISCPGGSWVIIGLGGPDSRTAARGTATVNADGEAPYTHSDKVDCTKSGTRWNCTFKELSRGEKAVMAFPSTRGWSQSFNIQSGTVIDDTKV